MSDRSMEYRVEMMSGYGTGKWVPVDGTSYGDKETANKKMDELRDFRDVFDSSNNPTLRVAERPLGEWTASKTPLDDAIERVTNALNTRLVWAQTSSSTTMAADVRLILTALQEAQK